MEATTTSVDAHSRPRATRIQARSTGVCFRPVRDRAGGLLAAAGTGRVDCEIAACQHDAADAHGDERADGEVGGPEVGDQRADPLGEQGVGRGEQQGEHGDAQNRPDRRAQQRRPAAQARDSPDRALVLHAAVATDLRIVVSAVHGAGDIERMGGLARHVAQTARSGIRSRCRPRSSPAVSRS